MESTAIFDSLQFDNVKALLCPNRLRLLELCAALLLLSCCSSRLSLAWISAFLAGHVFFFFISNLIILTLLANSGWLSKQTAGNAQPDLVNNSAYGSNSIPETQIHNTADKEMIAAVPDTIDGEERSDFDYLKDVRRRKSEVEHCLEKSDVKRSETYCREMVSAAGYGGEENVIDEEEEMSNEEFQRTIEAFIAKQLKFRRQESISGAVSDS